MKTITMNEMLKSMPTETAERIMLDKKLYGMTEFTRRVPTFRTKEQERRDAKIVERLIKLWDEQHDGDGLIRYFQTHCKLLSNPIYWETLRTVWVAAGSTETAPLFRPLMQSKRLAKSWFMTVEDKATLDQMPDTLHVYRAFDKRYLTEPDPGLSWTLDKEWCINYAKHHDRIIKERDIDKKDCFAYISRRGEEEIIIL